MSDRLETARRWVRRNVESATPFAIALAVAGFWAFVELADEVVEGSTRHLDHGLLLLLRTKGNLANPL